MQLVRQIVAWAESSSVAPLSADAVPGASETERVSLAALGGLAGALARRRVKSWPSSLREWADAPPPPPTLVTAAKEELSGGIDVLAAVYENLVTGKSRRRLGTFFTPPAVVQFMLDLAESHVGRPKVIIDPGAGVGAFSAAAARRWPDSCVLAVDVNVVTLGLMAARDEGRIRLIHRDFLEWTPEDGAPSDGPRLWIGNPPYTRHQELSETTKAAGMEAAGGLVQSYRAGLSTYFLAATLRARNPNDVVCYLLPGSWLDTSYGRPLRRSLLESAAGSLEMYGFQTEIDLFPGTRVAAMALLVGKDGERRTLKTASARISSGVVTVSRHTHRDRLHLAERFGHWVWPRSTGARRGRVPLRVIADVRRGVATGANRFFFLSDSQRNAIPPVAVRPGILRLRRVEGESLDVEEHDRLGAGGERRWLLVLDDPALLQHDTIAKWIESAEETGIDKRYLTSRRDPWYLVETIEPPDILVSPMSKARLRAVTNRAGAVPSNALYGIYLNGQNGLAEPLTAWLNSEAGQVALRAQARTYGRGLVKLEPSDLGEVMVPDIEDLATAKVTEEAVAFITASDEPPEGDRNDR